MAPLHALDLHLAQVRLHALLHRSLPPLRFAFGRHDAGACVNLTSHLDRRPTFRQRITDVFITVDCSS